MSFSGWKEVSLDDTCIKITDGSHYSPKAKTEGYPMLTVKDMRDFGFDYLDCKLISEEDFQIMIKNDCVPIKGDVLVAKDGSFLKHVFTVKENRKEAVLSSIAIFRPNPDIIISEFLKYFILNPTTKSIIADNYVSGSAIPRIVLKDFKKIPVVLPPLQEQKAIAHILSTLDEKIETNNRINKTLEEMAQAIFKHWFVDFEFPNEDGEPYKSSGGEMVESELGPIPKGWEEKSIYDLADYINGTSFKKDEIGGSFGIPIIKIAEIKGGYNSSTSFYNNSTSKDRKYFLKKKDLLFSWSGNPDTSIDIFIWPRDEGILNQHIFKVVPVEVPYSYLFLLLKSFKPIFTEIASNKQTTGLGHVTIGDLKRLKVCIPTCEIIEKFASIADVTIDKIYSNLIENQILEGIRDSLLPKLMSGEIRVPLDIEEQ